jgi:hypothetical protein
LVVFGIQNSKLSEKSLYNYSRIAYWREIYQAFEMQLKNLNYYVVLADQKEKEKFNEQTAIIEKQLANSPLNETGEQAKWGNDYRKYIDTVENSFFGNTREKQFDVFNNQLGREGNKLHTELKDSIVNYTKLLNELELTIKNLNRFSVFFSIATGAIAVFSGIFMSFLIFKSISKPLNIL